MNQVICQKCKERDAVIHYTNIVNGMKVEKHLCQICAKEEQSDLLGQMAFPLQQWLSGLLLSEAHHMTHAKQVPVIACPTCGLTYETFVKQGKFQCTDCYVAFAEVLVPLFEKLHNKNHAHVGKIPKRGGEEMIFHRKLLRLKQELKNMVAIENFEEAARLRDEIRALEQTSLVEGDASNEES